MCEESRERRKALGITLADLAERVGVSEATLSRYEGGICVSPAVLEPVGNDYAVRNTRLAEAVGLDI